MNLAALEPAARLFDSEVEADKPAPDRKFQRPGRQTESHCATRSVGRSCGPPRDLSRLPVAGAARVDRPLVPILFGVRDESHGKAHVPRRSWRQNKSRIIFYGNRP